MDDHDWMIDCGVPHDWMNTSRSWIVDLEMLCFMYFMTFDEGFVWHMRGVVLLDVAFV